MVVVTVAAVAPVAPVDMEAPDTAPGLAEDLDVDLGSIVRCDRAVCKYGGSLLNSSSSVPYAPVQTR